MSAVRLRLTVCLSTVAVTAVLGGVLAPAASAHHEPSSASTLPGHAGASSGVAPSVLSGVPPFGRRIG